MGAVDAAFHRLEPIAFLQPLGGESLIRVDHDEFPLRRRGLLLRRPHICPQDAAAFDQRVGFQFYFLAKTAFLGLGRHIQAFAFHIVFPAMIGATNAAFLIAAEP